MNKVLISFLIPFMICCALTNVSAQQVTSPASLAALAKDEDSLKICAARLFSTKGNIERFEENSRFIKLLVGALKTSGSFNYGFDSLKTISIVTSPDDKFRIFSWYVPTDEGTYRFFGTIQMSTKDGQLKLFPLIDDTANITDNNEITTNKKWYGARYYEVIPLEMTGGNISYALLGWKGNNNKTSKKVIEILSFENGTAQFGKPIFQPVSITAAATTGSSAVSNPPSISTSPVTPRNRIVFEYNKLNSMTLRMDKNEGMIVFDHLAPFDPNMEGNFEYYASDSSFDGYRLMNGKLKLMENIELKNDPGEQDDFYIDPKMKNPPVVKKF